MLLSEAVERFDLSRVGRSGSTRQWYRRMAGALVDFLGDPELEKVMVDDLRRFHAALETRALSPFTILAHLRAVKILFRWCADEGLIESDPSRRLKLPRAPDQEPKAISREDVERMGGGGLTVRDRPIVEFSRHQ